jgi:hypothetical protein
MSLLQCLTWVRYIKLNFIIIIIIISVDVGSNLSFDASFNFRSCCLNNQISMHSSFQFTLL